MGVMLQGKFFIDTNMFLGEYGIVWIGWRDVYKIMAILKALNVIFLIIVTVIM